MLVAWVSVTINGTAKIGNLSDNGAREMEFGLFEMCRMVNTMILFCGDIWHISMEGDFVPH